MKGKKKKLYLFLYFISIPSKKVSSDCLYNYDFISLNMNA